MSTNRPALNMQSILAEDEVSAEDSWMLSYIDVFVLMTTLFIVLMVIHKPEQGEFETNYVSEVDEIAIQETPFEGPVAPKGVVPTEVIVPTSVSSSKSDWREEIASAIEMHELEDLVNFKSQSDVTELDIASRVLFSSGDAALTRSGEAVLEKLLPVLSSTSGMIYVEGHTDDQPIETPKFPSNWELASSRATEVLQFFVSKGMSKERFRVVSYADTKPIVPNDSVQNRKRNRRVSLVIQGQ